MSGYYEKHWQDALAGASIQPSESLWENIEANLTEDGGNRVWLTVLLIAATITIAFAFPLTIGNSSFEARPDDYNFTVQSGTQEGNLTSDVQTQAQIAQVNPVVSGLPAENITQPVPIVKETVMPQKIIAGKEQHGINEILAMKRLGLSAMTVGAPVADNQLEHYYLIPYYVPAIPGKRSGLLASVNMGTGSSSAGSGFSGFGAYANADLAAMPEFTGQDPDNRAENSGNTYYMGAGVELPLGKRWSFLAGIGYLGQTATGTSNIVFNNEGNYQPLGAYDPIVPGTVFLSESYTYSVTNSYINVPLTLKYPFINRKVKFRIGAGLSTDFMVGHGVNSDVYGKVNYKPSSMEYSPVVFAGLLNMDVSYSVNNLYSVAFETGLRKGFTSIDKNKEYYPSSFTMGLVLFYKIQ